VWASRTKGNLRLTADQDASMKLMKDGSFGILVGGLSGRTTVTGATRPTTTADAAADAAADRHLVYGATTRDDSAQ
jgi:hypothetical protein